MRQALIALLLLLPTLALAGPKEIQGHWQLHLTAEEQAQVDALKKEAEATPEDAMAKAMLKAMLSAAEAKVLIDDETMTFEVMGETVPAKYTSTVVEGGWNLATTADDGEKKTLTVSITKDGMLQLTNAEGKASLFKRLK